MAGIVLAFGGIATMCAAGFAVSTVLQWFHSYEIPMGEKSKRGKGMSDHARSKFDDLGKRTRHDS